MDEEGIMALGPRPTDQMAAPEEQISYNEAYGATKNALREYRPEIADQYETGMGEILAEVGALTGEELDALRELVDYIEKNRDRYPQVIAELVAQDIIDEGDFPPEYDEQFMAVLRAAIEEAYQRGIAMPIAQMPQQFAGGGLASLAAQGRFGDTMLAHITPQEAAMLKAMGGSGTINPQTGLPEFFIGKIFKAIGKAIKGIVKGVKKVLNSPIGRIIGTVALTPFVGPVAAGAIVGGVTGGVKGAILGGIGGYISGSGFMDSALGSSIGKSFTSALGETGAKFAINTLTNTAMGLAGGASLGDAVKGGVAGAAFNYAMTRARPTPAPIEDRSLTVTNTPASRMTGSAVTAPASAAPTMAAMQAPVPGSTEFFNQGRVQTTSANIAAPQTPTAATVSAAQTPTAPPPVSSTSNLATKMGIEAPQMSSVSAPPAPTPPPIDFGINRLLSEPVSYAKDVYSTYLSPSREGLSPKAGIIEKYGPLTAAGIGAMYLGGGFEPGKSPGSPGIVPRETGSDLIARTPSRFLIQNLPGVNYTPEGDIFSSSPYRVNTPTASQSVVPTESIFSYGTGFQPASFQTPSFNRGGIANLSRNYPRMNGQISGPGTEKSDDIPAMLSDGEFVMTARAVRGMGGGSRREGAKRMYKLMAALEKNAAGGR